MNKNYLMLLALVALGLSACRSDERTPSGGGYLAVRVAADNEVVSAASRAEGDGIPDVGDFSLSIAKENGELVSKWDKFSDYDAEATVVPVGTYTVSASYGDATTEGFDGLSYAGSTTANVAEGETTDVTIDCTINKARVSISYTDAFKSYFTSYSAYVSSSRGNKIDYTADETRAAYFTPGNLDVYLNVTRPGVSGSVALKVKTLAAEVKHEYRLTMDVDAGTSTLNIIFNDDPESTQNVEFNISDAALNAPAPTIVAHGFTSDEPMEVVEGGSVEGTLQAYLNAPSGLASCELVTSSAALKAQGWPEKVDLMALSAEDQQKLTELGLVMKGLGSTHDKIATVEFQNVVPYLYCTGDGNEEHSFTLTATDVYGKTTEPPLVLNVTSCNNGFAVTLPESVPYGSNTMSFTMNLEGDASKVKFYYSAYGADQLFTEDNVSIFSDGTTHTVTLTYPDPLIDTESDVKFKAEYGSKTIENTFKVEDPALTLSLKNGDADVWAVPYLYCTGDGNEEHSFTLTATDVYGKTTEPPLVLNVTSCNNGFAVTLPESVPYGSNTMSFTMNLEGDASKVKFYYSAYGADQLFTEDNVSIFSDGTTHTVTLTYPDPLIDTESDVKFKAEYGSKTIENTFKVEDPALTLSLKNGDADVWAKHVNFQVAASAKSRSSRTVSASTIEIQYKDSDDTWKKCENVSFDGQNGFEIKGLISNTSYTFRAVYLQREYSNEQTIKTEEELGVPNAGMEEWFSNKIAEDGTDLSGNNKVYWNKWYPWTENDEKSKGWNTLNQTTTQYGAKPSTFLGLPTSPYVGCCYTTNSGTIRTDDKNTGTYAALIRTVGWGKGNTANAFSGNMGTCENVTPGELYLGTYDVASHQPKYGYSFVSRPSAIQFMYKYQPKNAVDWFEVMVEVKDASGNVLANKTITKTGEVSTYTSEKIELEYTVAAKAAILSIIFKSSGNENCWGANTDNLNPPPGANLSDGEYVGSQLYIDDVELIYEY